MKKTVSVIIPVYNAFCWSESIYDSIEGNRGHILEVILINDGDREDYEKLINNLASKLNGLIIIAEAGYRTGPANARNIGIKLAKGEYIAFLDCDDLWLDGSLNKRLALLIDNPCAPFVYSSFENVNINTNKKTVNFVVKEVYAEDLCVTCYICLPSVIIKSNVIKKIMFKDAKAEDLFLWLKILSHSKYPAVGVLDVTVERRLGFDSMSSNKVLAAWWHLNIIVRFLKGYSFIFLPLLMLLYVLNGVAKRKRRIYKPFFLRLNKLLLYTKSVKKTLGN